MMTTNMTAFKKMGSMLSLVFSDYDEARVTLHHRLQI